MAAQQILPEVPLYARVEVDFTSNWNATSPSYTDVTADLRFGDGFSWERGKSQAWDQLATGQFGFTLNNRAGTYEPATNSNMVGARPTRLTLYYPDTSTPFVQMVGAVDQFEVVYPAYGKDQVVQVSGVDWIASLWLTKIVSLGLLSNTVVGSYKSVCSQAGIPTAWQSFTAGTFTLKPFSYTKTDCLSALGQLANSQMQFLYVSRDGVITSVPLTSGSVTQTYSDTSTTYPYSDVKGGVGGQGSYTIVELSQPEHAQVMQQGGDNPPATANVPGTPLPKTKFGTQTLQINAAPVTNPATLAATWAGAVPSPSTYWWRELEIKPLKAPATLIPAVLGHELGDRITVVRHPLQGGTISKNASIRSIKHDIKGGDWTVTFGLTNR